jgi:hypothetical protein
MTEESSEEQRWAQATFFLSPQSQFRNLKEAFPQSHSRNFLKKFNSAIEIFSDVRNLRASFPQFSAYCLPWNQIHEKKSEVKNLVQLSL